MQIVLWIAAIAVGLFAFDRLALWAEERGWIYWRRKKPRTGDMSSMLVEMSVFTNPSAEHVIAAKEGKKFEERQNGDDDPPRET